MADRFAYQPDPVVMRCGRCGKSVAWQGARLNVVCSCRPFVELPPVPAREATDSDRPAVMDLFRRDFGRSKIVAFGDLAALDDAPALVAEMKHELAGALAYRLRGDGLQIVALATEPAWQRSGVAGHLVAEAELLARKLHLRTVIVCTTNDNLPALYFYQRRGYHIAGVAAGALVPPGEPARPGGFAGIEVRDEIRLEKALTARPVPQP